jgi:hypothetical protein|tara:strand:+ start:735 stop:1124 length:390 start_codon:yes stop_codon:yes gene_type:complete
MPQNYTLSVNMSMTASSATGYSQSQSGAYTLNITGVDQIATGRIDVAHDGDSTIMAAPGHGRFVYIKNLDDTNFVKIYDGASSAADYIGILKPGEFLMTIIRGTGTTVARADTATVTVEYAAVEIDSNA